MRPRGDFHSITPEKEGGRLNIRSLVLCTGLRVLESRSAARVFSQVIGSRSKYFLSGPNFAPRDAEGASVGAICREPDGLPRVSDCGLLARDGGRTPGSRRVGCRDYRARGGLSSPVLASAVPEELISPSRKLHRSWQ
jgi:hypothetical protein